MKYCFTSAKTFAIWNSPFCLPRLMIKIDLRSRALLQCHHYFFKKVCVTYMDSSGEAKVSWIDGCFPRVKISEVKVKPPRLLSKVLQTGFLGSSLDRSVCLINLYEKSLLPSSRFFKDVKRMTLFLFAALPAFIF